MTAIAPSASETRINLIRIPNFRATLSPAPENNRRTNPVRGIMAISRNQMSQRWRNLHASCRRVFYKNVSPATNHIQPVQPTLPPTASTRLFQLLPMPPTNIPSSRPKHHAPVFVMRSGEIPALAVASASAFGYASALPFLSVIPAGNLLPELLGNPRLQPWAPAGDVRAGL